MVQLNTTPITDVLIDEWLRQTGILRFFFPSDFQENASRVTEENLVYRKTATECLTMSDQVESMYLQLHQASVYSSDLDYRPGEFKDETLEIITGANNVSCFGCSGGGIAVCWWCSGSGKARCETRMNCPQCHGSGRQKDTCRNCGGNGKIFHHKLGKDGKYRNETTRCASCRGVGTIEVNCLGCGRSGKVVCSKCGGVGLVDCSECFTTGKVECSHCDGVGQLVSAEIITREFKASEEVVYRLGNLAANEFKNGLSEEQFAMNGVLILEEFQQPANADIVLQRQTVHSWDVFSARYSYKDQEFWLNRITGDGHSEYTVAEKLPISIKKILIAVLVVYPVVSALIGLSIVL